MDPKSMALKRRCNVAEAEAGRDRARDSGHRRPGQTVACGWCGRAVEEPARGRVPSWCSSSCRHRAWEFRQRQVGPLEWTSARKAVSGMHGGGAPEES
jgi:hypothetical protein